MSDQLEEKIDILTRELQKHHSWLWLAARALVGAIFSTIGVIFVLTAGVYILQKLEVLPGLNLLIEQLLPSFERYQRIRGF